MSVPLVISELKVDASSPFDIPYPALDVNNAVCIGLTIDWQQYQPLYAAAQRHTRSDEHVRAGRYLRIEDSLRHLLGRALLRRVASFYGGADATKPIGVNEWGKPLLPMCRVGCNVSHAGSQVWIAVSPHARVGIDVESATPPPDVQDIAANFHSFETEALSRMADGDNAVMRCWSRKESVSKAMGMGLSLPLDAFAVDCTSTVSNWLRIVPPGTVLQNWTTTDLPIGGDYIGALAVEGQCEKISVMRLVVDSSA